MLSLCNYGQGSRLLTEASSRGAGLACMIMALLRILRRDVLLLRARRGAACHLFMLWTLLILLLPEELLPDQAEALCLLPVVSLAFLL